VLEAMSQGAAASRRRAPSTAEVAGDAALLVDPLDESAIATAIEELLDDRALAERLRAGRSSSRRDLHWDRTAAATMAVYAEALK